MNRLAQSAAWMFAALILLSCQPAEDARSRIESTGVIRVGIEASYPPFAMAVPGSDEVAGFDADLMRAVWSSVGYRVEFVPTAFDRLIPHLNAGEFDVIASAFTITTERQEQVLFSLPYFETGQVVTTLAADTLTHGIGDLHGKRVGVQIGTTGEAYAMRMGGVEVFRYEQIADALDSLRAGRLDAVIDDESASRRYVDDNTDLHIVGGVLSQERYGIAFRRSDAWLQTQFNDAFFTFRASGRFDSLLQRYFGATADAPLESEKE